VKDATQSMNNAAVTHQDGVLTLSFERALNTGDDEDLSFSDNCYYFIFPVGGGLHSNNDFSQHADTPVFSPNKICNGESQTPFTPSWSQTGPKLVANPLARASSLDDGQNSSSLQVCDQLRTCMRQG